MSKNKSRGPGDRKGEGTGGESVAPHMITSQTVTPGLHTVRQNPALTTGHTYIVQPHHEMKNFSKSARPIAPAPPTQSVQNLSAHNVQSSQTNIPSIISPSLAQGSNDNLISLNLITTTASSHNPIAVPVTLSQASVFQLGSNITGGNLSVVQQGISGSTVPVTMLRGSNSSGQQPQSHIQAFAQNFSHLPRGTSPPVISKSTGLLRQGTTSAALQIPGGLNTLPLPIVRAPLLQTVKTTTPQVTRPQSPAVGGQQVPPTQPQDLSRTNFPMHGSITPVMSANMGPLSMHVTLNRIDNTSVNSDAPIIQNRAISAQVPKDAPANIQQRISVSLSTDSNLHSRLTSDLVRSTLPFSGPTKVSHPSSVPQSKVVSSQHGASLKSVNLAVTTPVMINSINPSQTAAITTVASSVPIPIAKVTPQRQLPVGSIPSSLAPLPHSSSPLSVTSASLSVPHISMTSTSLPPSSGSSLPVSLPTSMGEAGPMRHEQANISSSQSSSGGIMIASDFQTRTPGSIITMTTLASSIQGTSSPLVVSQAENRSTSQNQQQFDVKPGDSMWLQHLVFQTQSPLIPQPAQIIRPGTNTFAFLPSQGKILTQTPNMAASQLAAMSSNVRFNSGPVMMVEHLRQQHHHHYSMHSTFNTGTTTVSGTGEKAAHLLARATVASNNYTTSAGVQSQIPGGGGGGSSSVHGGLSAIPISNPSSSPRPSILRKRTSEAAGVVIRKPNFNLNQDSRCHSPPRVDTNSTSICSPKISIKNFSPVSENSQSSTDTALSSNDATTPTHNHHEKGKGDAEECLENSPTSSLSTVNNIPASPAISHADSISEASPRKRARKQLLHVSEELKDNMSSSEEEMEKNTLRRRADSMKDHNHTHREIHGEYTDEDGVRWVLNKPKPTYVLLQPDFINNKTRNNHFTRYSDVKPKEERRPTVNELSNQRGIMQKVNGWKLYFSASQLEELMEVEKEMEEEFVAVQAALAQTPTNKINNEEAVKIHEMSQANIQRCQLIQSQLSDARAAMIRTLEHKSRIHEIVNKHMSKRPIKKKERT